MLPNKSGLIWRLAAFLTVCLLGTAVLITIYGQLRFPQETTYNAIFDTVSGLKNGNFVRIAGVEVGKVADITIRDDATAQVTFTTDDSVVLTEGSRAVVRYLSTAHSIARGGLRTWTPDFSSRASRFIRNTTCSSDPGGIVRTMTASTIEISVSTSCPQTLERPDCT